MSKFRLVHGKSEITYIYVCVHRCVYTCVYTYQYIYIYNYSYKCIYTYTYTYIYIYIHTAATDKTGQPKTSEPPIRAGINRGSRTPTPSWPSSPAPHTHSVPSSDTAHVCNAPHTDEPRTSQQTCMHIHIMNTHSRTGTHALT